MRGLRLAVYLTVAALVASSLAAGQAQGPVAPVPEPREVFGFRPGDDYKLASHEQIVEFFRKLDAASDRIMLEEIGTSTEGRAMVLALISSAANLENRARYKAISRQLALARGIDEAQARALAKEGKAIIWIDGGLHATKAFPERRLYPGGPPDPPYDMTGYELSLQMGIKADRVEAAFRLPSQAVDEIPPAPGGVQGRGERGFAVAPNLNLGVKAVNRLLKAGARVARVPDGTLIVQKVARDLVEEQGRELGVSFRGLETLPGDLQPLRAPRIGLYKSFLANMDEGWTRWLLEQYEFSFTSLSNRDIRTGDLSQYDVILFADEEAEEILNGHLDQTMPDAYVGGIGVEGAANVQRFVENGGWLLAWDRAADFAILTFGLPLSNTVKSTRAQEFFIPGSLLRITTKTGDPLAAGMEPDAIAMFSSSQAFALVPQAAEGKARAPRDVDVFVEYAREDVLASGWELGGARYVAGRVAGARVPVGKGQVVVLGFRPHWRGQPHNTFKLLFNPLFLSTLDAAALKDGPTASVRGGGGRVGRGSSRVVRR